MYRDYGISQNRPLWFDVHEDKRTKLEGDPKGFKILASKTPREQNSRSGESTEIWENYVTELYDRPNRPETLEVEPEE